MGINSSINKNDRISIMIKPAKLDLIIYQGATFFKRFTWKDRRAPIDITGYTFKMQIRPSIDSTTVLAEYTSATGEFYLEDPANGVFVLEVDNAITEGYSFDEAVYDIECTYPDGRVSRMLYGRVSLSREVTR